MIKYCLLFMLLVLLLALPDARAADQASAASGDWIAQQSALCASAIRDAEARHRLPAGLLESIARAESGRPVTTLSDIRPWPWTINADGDGFFLDSKNAAVAWVTLQRSRRRYIDVGCMQVDLAYHPKAFASLEEAFDPKANAEYAAQYLTGLYRGEAAGDWNIAVGLYHSHSLMLAAAYRDRVAMAGSRILDGVLEPVPLYMRAIRQGTLRVPLANGRSTPINVRRQPSARSHHRPTSCEIARILGPYLNGAGGARCAPASDSPR